MDGPLWCAVHATIVAWVTYVTLCAILDPRRETTDERDRGHDHMPAVHGAD